jgi:hypothetical protein
MIGRRPGWIAGERVWLHRVFERDLDWGSLLVELSFITLVTVSLMGWLGVAAVLLDSLFR